MNGAMSEFRSLLTSRTDSRSSSPGQRPCCCTHCVPRAERNDARSRAFLAAGGICPGVYAGEDGPAISLFSSHGSTPFNGRSRCYRFSGSATPERRGSAFPRRSLGTRRSDRRASVLLLVLVVIAILSLAGYTFSELMFTERKATELSGQKIQAEAAAESGVQYTRLFLMKTADAQNQLGGWYDNSTAFRGLVADDVDPRHRSRFTIVAPAVDSQGLLADGVRYGLQDESCRLNLNTLLLAEKTKKGSARTILLALPGMTEQTADAILDWIDTDSDVREYGAEIETYANLSPPYAPKNGPLDSIEELLLVQGVTPWLLFGCDANRNGRIDAGEPDANSIPDVDNSDGSMTQGWAAYLTLYSMEKNVKPDGTPRINLNGDDLQTLYDDLTDALGETAATFIVAYRQNGADTSQAKATENASVEIDPKAKGTKPTKLKTILDLVGAKVSIKTTKNKKTTTTTLGSPFPNIPGVTNALLTSLMDNCTINASPVIPGRININQAPRTLLAGIPGMTTEMVDQIISSRIVDPKDADASRGYETWLLDEGIVTLDQMKALMPFVTGGGSVFRAQVVGYFDGGGPAARLEVVIDATASPPRVVFWRDISHLGRGYPVEILGMEAQ
jgi:type II secretory pathway component PulK